MEQILWPIDSSPNLCAIYVLKSNGHQIKGGYVNLLTKVGGQKTQNLVNVVYKGPLHWTKIKGSCQMVKKVVPLIF